MPLSEVLATLEIDESIKFTRDVLGVVRFVLKKGDESEAHREVNICVDVQTIRQGQLDIMSHEVDKAIRIIRDAVSDDLRAIVKQKLDLMCPLCDREAEFERASGFGGINLCELFLCEWCDVKIERHCRYDGTISRIEVGTARG